MNAGPLDPLGVALSGTQLVEASAGTGKTYTIGGLYLRLVIEHRLAVSEILVVTFTKAATAELRQRIRARLQTTLLALTGRRIDDPFVHDLVARIGRGKSRADATHRVREALLEFDNAAIYTIHGYCQRLLSDGAFETGSLFDAELLPDDRPLLERAAYDYWLRQTADMPRWLAGYSRRSEFMPGPLIRLLHAVANDPDLAITGADEPPPFDALQQAWQTAIESLAAHWNRARNDVLACLHAPELNRTKYGPTQIPKWADQLDELFECPEVGVLGGPKAWPFALRLTPAGLADGARKGQRPPQHPFFVEFAEFAEHDAALEQRLAAFVRARQRECIETVFPELARSKAERGQQGYSDLLREVDRVLDSSDGEGLRRHIEKQYKAALIDEFQDTDPTQFRIFRRAWPTRRPMFLIGDPKQAIYAFRGADLFAYLRAASATEGRTHTLAVNWRSDPGLIAALNALFGRPYRAFAIDELEYRPVQARDGAQDLLQGDPAHCVPLELVVCSDDGEPFTSSDRATQACAAQCVDDIVDLLRTDLKIDTAPVSAKHVAILTRTNVQAADMQQRLAEQGIVAVLHTDASVFDAPEAEELARIVAAIEEPSHAPTLRGALTTVILGGNAESIANLTDEALDTWLDRFRRAASMWQTLGCYAALDRLFAHAEVEARLLGYVGGERQLTNLLHLCELLHRACADSYLGPAAAHRWLEELRTDPALRAARVGDSAQLRLEDDADAVQIITAHRAKGLEYPIVYCPFSWGPARVDAKWPRFHDAAHEHVLTLDLGSSQLDEHVAAADREAFSEEVRLIYVALTRAKHRCSVYWAPPAPKRKGVPSLSPLGFLLHATAASSDTAIDRAPAERLATQDHLAELLTGGASAIARDLERLVAQAPSTMAIRHGTRRDEATPPPLPRLTIAGTQPARVATRSVTGPWRSTSYSALVFHVADEADHDALPLPDSPVVEPPVSTDPVTVSIEAFPGGARTGEFIHRVLEGLDSPPFDDARIRSRVVSLAPAFGFVDTDCEPIVSLVANVLHTPLDAARDVPPLAQIPARVHEMPFTLPVRHEAAALDNRQLLDALRHIPSTPAADYAARRSLLDFPPVAGYLRGYIDLVFEHAGRYYVLDYKSNKLGTHPSAYATESLWEEMCRHDYVLQYLLYCVAVHRHLRHRVPNYDPAQHFGGVYYLFVRGMDPRHPARGVFFDPVAPKLLERLDQLLTEVQT